MSEREIGRKALYNLLRMNCLEDDSMQVEPWQVQDYRELELSDLISNLAACGIDCDEARFLELAEQFDHPESLADALTEDDATVEDQDRIFLNIFEMWRRFIHNKPSLTVFADELDHQIYLYDHQSESEEDLKNVLEYFQEVIEGSPNQEEVFMTMASECANDIEAFLYDFLADQLDKENYLYVSGVVDRLYSAVPYPAPFDFLLVRLQAVSDGELAQETLEALIRDLEEQPDFDLGLEVLSYLHKTGAKREFFDFVQMMLEQVESDEDALALLDCCHQYFKEGSDSASVGEIEAWMSEVRTSKLSYQKVIDALENLIGSHIC